MRTEMSGLVDKAVYENGGRCKARHAILIRDVTDKAGKRSGVYSGLTAQVSRIGPKNKKPCSGLPVGLLNGSLLLRASKAY